MGQHSEQSPAPTSLDVVREHVLDPWNTEIGILNCAYAVDSLHNPDTAAAMASAVNDWLVAEWLEPEPRHALVALQAALQAAFPFYDEQSRFATGFAPHLSVGQAASPSARQHLLSVLQAAWQPVQFTLTAIMLIWRESAGPFEVAHAIPLGSRSPSPRA